LWPGDGWQTIAFRTGRWHTLLGQDNLLRQLVSSTVFIYPLIILKSSGIIFLLRISADFAKRIFWFKLPVYLFAILGLFENVIQSGFFYDNNVMI